MNSTIWKYPLKVTDEQIINLPIGSEYLSVQVQNGTPCLWAKVNPQENVIIRVKIVTVGTGHPADHVNEYMQFLGTYQLFDGEFVGHVFVGGA